MTTELLPSAVSIYVEANGKYLGASEEGLRLLRYYLNFSAIQNNDKLCTFGQFSRLTNDEMMKDFKEGFVSPAVKKWGPDLVDTNGSENSNYWKVDLRVLVEKIELAKQPVKKEYGKISTENWSLISNPRVFDMEIYFLDKGSKYREPKEFFKTFEYQEIEAIADFFNDLVSDLKKKNKLD